MRRSWQHGPVFSPTGRSGGSQALQLPHLPSRRGSPPYSPAPDRAPQKSEIPAPVPSSPIEEVWKATSPPAPTSPVSPRQPAISPPLPTAHRRSRKNFSNIASFYPTPDYYNLSFGQTFNMMLFRKNKIVMVIFPQVEKMKNGGMVSQKQ